jgi:fructosamine-3-kinase
MNDALRESVERAVAGSGAPQWRRVGRTGWGDAWSLARGGRRYFVKTATGAHADMPACEADGLRALEATHTLRVPAIAAVA